MRRPDARSPARSEHHVRASAERDHVRTIELQGIDNVRDLGGIPVRGGRMVAPGLVYRGSALASITPADQDILFNKLGISLVVDLRCGWERAAAPDIEVPGVQNLHIPFYDLEKVGIEYTEPAAGTKVVGRDVACDPDRFYRSLANSLTANQMRDGLARIFAHAEQGRAAYLHCSGGKDRAGVMAMLILVVLGASREDILEDYLLTNVSRDKNYQKTFERFLRLADGNEERAHELTRAHRAVPANLDAFCEAVVDRYGSMDAFLHGTLAITEARCEQLRARCTCPCEQQEAHEKAVSKAS